jgi:hypothetical protein
MIVEGAGPIAGDADARLERARNGMPKPRRPCPIGKRAKGVEPPTRVAPSVQPRSSASLASASAAVARAPGLLKPNTGSDGRVALSVDPRLSDP